MLNKLHDGNSTDIEYMKMVFTSMGAKMCVFKVDLFLCFVGTLSFSLFLSISHSMHKS